MNTLALKVIYVASDGKEFEDKMECLNYETKLSRITGEPPKILTQLKTEKN